MIGQEECIKRFRNAFPNNEYDYSRVIYRGQQKPVEIYCCVCEKWFFQKPEYHWGGHSCKECGKKSSEEKRRISKEGFLKKAKEKHGNKYKYTNFYIKDKKSYIEYDCLNCKKHNIQTVYDHLNGHGCSCSKRLKKDEVLKRFHEIHGDKYDYSLMKYSGTMKRIRIICKKHNVVFKQIVQNHLDGSGCPICNLSSGEAEIEKELKNKNLYFEKNKEYDDLVDVKKLSYDFFIPKLNILIEFNGKQHYEPVNWSGKMSNEQQLNKLKVQRHHDWLKRKYAKNNKLKLIIIPYWKQNDIKNIIDEII